MKIFVICDSPHLFTGLARVNRNIIRGLASNNHEVIIGAWGWDQLAYPINEDSQWIYEDPFTKNKHIVFPLTKIPTQLLIQVYEILKVIEFDIVLTMGDYWSFAGFELLKSRLDYSYKWISYYTFESSPINEEYYQAFDYMDEIVSPSKFGKAVVENSTGHSCHYVPYGIDSNLFYKIDEKTKQNERKKRNLDEKFRFINVSKNQNRKNIPAFLEAIKIVNEEDDRAIGYLHTNCEKKMPSQVHIKNMIKRFGVEDIISLPDKKLSLDIGYSDKKLNIEYNCSDALVLSSVAEGFGFPILEAQMCGIPVVATNCSSITELCFNKNFLVDSMKYYSSMEQEVVIIKVDDLVEKMLMVMQTTKNSDKLINFSKGFSWKLTNNRIENIISGMNKNIVIPVEEV